eukprot:COSAG02_NODE_8409_length_2582_cov_90.864277_1_plen_94_part_00
MAQVSDLTTMIVYQAAVAASHLLAFANFLMPPMIGIGPRHRALTNVAPIQTMTMEPPNLRAAFFFVPPANVQTAPCLVCKIVCSGFVCRFVCI